MIGRVIVVSILFCFKFPLLRAAIDRRLIHFSKERLLEIFNESHFEYNPDQRQIQALDVGSLFDQPYNPSISTRTTANLNQQDTNEIQFLFPKDKSVKDYIAFKVANKQSISNCFEEQHPNLALKQYFQNTTDYLMSRFEFPCKKTLVISLDQVQYLLSAHFSLSNGTLKAVKRTRLHLPNSIFASIYQYSLDKQYSLPCFVFLPPKITIEKYVHRQINLSKATSDSILYSILTGLCYKTRRNSKRIPLSFLIEETERQVKKKIRKESMNFSWISQLAHNFDMTKFKKVYFVFDKLPVVKKEKKQTLYLLNYLSLILPTIKFKKESTESELWKELLMTCSCNSSLSHYESMLIEPQELHLLSITRNEFNNLLKASLFSCKLLLKFDSTKLNFANQNNLQRITMDNSTVQLKNFPVLIESIDSNGRILEYYLIKKYVLFIKSKMEVIDFQLNRIDSIDVIMNLFKSSLNDYEAELKKNSSFRIIQALNQNIRTSNQQIYYSDRIE